MEQAEQIKKLARHKQLLLLEKCRRDPYFWLLNYAKTYDEHNKESPVNSFPNKPYFELLVNKFVSKEKVLLVAKSRQMMVSWLFSALLLHEAQFYQYRKDIVFSRKEVDSHQMVERAKFIYNYQPLWLKNYCPLERRISDMPKGYLYFKNGSVMMGLPQGGDQVRSHVPTTAFLDEMAFQTEAEKTYLACLPCAQKIIGVSSAENSYFQKLVEL